MRVLPFALIGGASAALTGNAALDKVVEMLRDMKQKALDEGQEEKVQYTKWSTWIGNQIATAKEDIEKLTAEVETMTANRDAARTKKEAAQGVVAKKTKFIAVKVDEIKEMDATRAAEAEQYMKDSTELSDGIYACDQAIKGLTAVSKDTGAASFAQVRASVANGPKELLALLETLETDPTVSAHKATAARTVIEMIEKLRDEFDAALQKFTAEETNAKHNHSLGRQEATSLKKGAEEAKADAEALAAEQAEVEGKSEAARAEADKTNKSTKKNLKDLSMEKASKDSDFEARTNARAEEQVALDSAITALTSAEMSAGASQLDKANSLGSFLQMNSATQKKAQPNAHVAAALEFLRTKGASLGSKMLMQIAEAAALDPFAKVKKMINELVNRLEEEALAESTKNEACKKDMARDATNIENATDKKDKATARRDLAEAEVFKLTTSIKEMTEKLADLKKSRAEAVQMRFDEKNENETAIKEGEAAIVALGQAKDVLQDYYSKVNASLLQQPEYAGGAYKGVGGEGGILGMIDVLEQDMNRLVSETTAAESKAASDHAEFLNDTDSETSSTESAKRTAEENKATEEANLQAAKDDLSAAEEELASHMELKKNTDKRCTFQGASLEENQEKRAAEIQSLKEALTILESIEV